MFIHRLSIIISTLFLILSCDNGTTEKNGFRGVRWGTHISKMQKSEFIDGSKKHESFFPTDEWQSEWTTMPDFLFIDASKIRELGGVNLICKLGFFKGKFWIVGMEQLESGERFFEVLVRVFGNPSKQGFVHDTIVLLDSDERFFEVIERAYGNPSMQENVKDTSEVQDLSLRIERTYDVYIWEDGDTRREFRINIMQSEGFWIGGAKFWMYSKSIDSEVEKLIAIERLSESERDSVKLENAPADF